MPESSAIGLPYHQLPVTWTSSRGDRGEDFDWNREQFWMYYLNATQSVSAKI